MTGTARAVQVEATGLAGLTCAAALARLGHPVRVSAAAPGPPRWLVLPEQTVELLDAVWGGDLLAGGWPLARRQVRWGPGAPEATMAAPAVAVDGAVLNRRLADRLATAPGVSLGAAGDSPPGWLVSAAPPPGARPVTVGRRQMISAVAPLVPGVDPATVLVRTTQLGWVHLAPIGPDRALVQAMLPGPVENPLAVLARELATAGLSTMLGEPLSAPSVTPAAPALGPPPEGAGRLTVGAAALRLDPISGSGASQAIRTAILAAAVVGAVEAGAVPAAAALGHFASRLQAAFRAHLRSCLRLYGSGLPVPAWRDEQEMTALALRATPEPPPHDLVLTGLRLEPLPAPKP